MDKQQIARDILNKYKIGGYVPADRQPVDLQSRFAELDAVASGDTEEQRKKDRTTFEKISGFTGGEKIGQGLGQAVANIGISKDIEKVQAQQMDIQGNILSKIKEKKALGEDTSRLENALKLITEDISEVGQGAEKLLNQKELTTKQVLGDALQLGTTVLGAGQLPGMAKSAVAKTGIVAGAKQGAIQGAKAGAVYGTSTGVSEGLKADEDLGGIVKSGITGGVGGAVTGGLVGGLVGGVSGGIKQAKLNKQEKYLDAITPDTKDLTPTEYEELLNKGKITPKTSTQPARYVLSEGEKNVAKKYNKIFTNDPVKNTERIIDEISKKDKEVGVFLRKNNGIFNSGELKNNLAKKLEGIDDLLVSDEKLSKAKTSIVDNFVKGLKKNDMESLWKARKEFDRQIEKAFTGSPTLQNTIKKEFRNAVQDFISERTPDGVYKTAMKEMSELFNLKDIVNTKAVKEKGMNAIQLWVKRHPTRAKIIGGVAGTGILTGVGSSLIK